MFWCLPLLHRWDCLLKHPFKCDFPPELQEELGCVCVCVCSMEYNYECSVICVEFFPFCVFTNISLCWHLHSVREMWVSVCVWDFSAAFHPWLLPASSYMYRLDSWSTISSTSAVPWLKKKEKKNPFKSQLFLKSQLHSMAACNLYVFPHNVLYIIEQHFPTGCPQNPWWNLRGFAKYKW